MGIECAECERDLRWGHAESCSRFKPHWPCPSCGKRAQIDPGWECSACGHIWSISEERYARAAAQENDG